MGGKKTETVNIQQAQQQTPTPSAEEIALNKNGGGQQIKYSKKYTPIDSYKPLGKLVYSEDLINKLENKIG